LLVEGKQLAKEDIDTFESKETVGKIVEKKEQLNSVAQQLIVWPILILILGLPFAAGTFYGKHQQQHIFEMADDLLESQPIPITGYKIDRGDIRGSLVKELKILGFPAKISAISRRGAQLFIEVTVTNPLKVELELSFTGKSPVGDQGTTNFLKRHVSDLIIFPKESKKKTIEIFLPESFENKTFFVEFRMEVAGEFTSLTDRVTLGT
jgi:hypothetical protein